jgi:hypothetical protein
MVKKGVKPKSGKDSTSLNNKSLEIFYKIKARLEFIDDEPVTAYLILKRDTVYSLLKNNSSAHYTGSLSKMTAAHRVTSVRVETEDGTIKNIIAHFVKPSTKVGNSSPRQYVEFKNIFPISISNKFDPDFFADMRLYCLNCNGIKGLDRFIKLSDLLVLDIVLENDKENYSPANTVVELTPTNTIVELRKEKRSRILDVSAFTDFTGLDQEEPNGLIQIEAKRRINIKTKSRPLRRFDATEDIANQLNLSHLHEVERRFEVNKKGNPTNRIIYTLVKEKEREDLPLISSKNIKVSTTKMKFGKVSTTGQASDTITRDFWKYEVTLKPKRFSAPHWVFANYVEPSLLFAKLEENNRFIDSLTLDGNKIDPVKLFQYQLVSFGATLNILRMSFPQSKMSWNVLSAGGYWFRSRVGYSNDSTRASVALNSSYLIGSTEWIFRPDSRWGVSMGANVIKPSLWNETYELANRHWLLQPYLNAFLKTNENDKLFFRFRWTYEIKERDNNFTQIQLGYNVNLFANTNSGSSAK